MGTWGIAKDMAKRNEENLELLSHKSLFQKLKDSTYKSGGKKYKFKKSTPELLEAIKAHQIASNRQLRIKKIIFLTMLILGALGTSYYLVMFAI